MKRKKINRKLRNRILVDDLAIDFTYEAPSDGKKHMIEVRILSGRTSDNKHFEIQFKPPLKKKDATCAQVRLIHEPTKHSQCSIVVIPKSNRQTPSQLNRIHYLTFDTHTIQLDPQTGEVILMYLSVHNVQMDGNRHSPPLYVPVFGLDHERYHGLPFFPPDPDVFLEDFNINASMVPQKSPMWFKLRGEVTGSLLPELLGFYVPEPGSKDAEKYEIGQKKTFDGWKAVGVRFGNMSEDYAALCLLEHNKELEFYECGYFPHPDPPTGNCNWGASPDGILIDPTIEYPEDFDDSMLSSDYDRNRGVVEIKSSRWNCDFNAYYFPQCIWEMVCAETGWCDVVRYCEKKQLDPKTRTWRIWKECKRVRLFRHQPTEDRMVKLVIQSLAARKKGKNVFLELMQSAPFVEMRTHFENIANAANQTFVNIPVASEKIQQLLDNRRAMIEAQTEHVPSLHPAIDRIDERQSEVFRLYQEPKRSKHKELVEAIANQVEDYMELLKSTL